ncbi:MAG TPA: sigma 54-interacting transcriptional regulator, partial [Polyangiaceae bacterium LLY-WYZ-15_(1-7)]|nr:sigma 54-interacting transcriptional regulator [Polyangiaceae bacterium LLY-WYZ-15_(1-7)]
EQHLRQLGRADEPVCWSLTGFASGYLSRAFDAPIFCVETRCAARGDAACRMVGRRREDWGEAIEAHLPYYEEDCLEEALRATTEALRRTERELGARRRVLARGLPEEDPSGCIAFSPKMRDALALARRAAKVDVTVLVRGETGVGKERLAQLVHEESPRAAGPFVAVNCGAIPASLLESELFGHAKGSFTGATQDRIGLFEAAQGGTLFLDEIGELAPETQVRLLRVLQEREVRRVGETAPRPIDVRVVAATHRDLRADIRAGRFREDLYYRLAVMEIEVAPLRERREDVLPLARLFLERASARTRPGEPALGLTPGAADRLLAHGWPGNVRELENAMERAAVVAEGERVDQADLPASVRAAAPAEDDAALTLAEAQRRHVERVLEAHGGHRAKTAAALGIGEATLYRMLARWRG